MLSIAFGYSGDTQIEIIHQHKDAPSCYHEFLRSGREGIHHISASLDTPDYDVAYARAIAAGTPSIHEGSIGGIRFAYFDTGTVTGACVCEISESDTPPVRAIFDSFRMAAAQWD